MECTNTMRAERENESEEERKCLNLVNVMYFSHLIQMYYKNCVSVTELRR